jgi:hypothetical protein
MVSTLNAKTSSNFGLWQPDEICRCDLLEKLSEQKINQLKRKFSQKNVFLGP